MALTPEPIEATQIISFGAGNDKARPAVISYNVPLAGRHTGQRIIELDFGLTRDEFKGAASKVPDSVQALALNRAEEGGAWTYNAPKALDFIIAKMMDAGLGTNPYFKNFKTDIRKRRLGGLGIGGPLEPLSVDDFLPREPPRSDPAAALWPAIVQAIRSSLNDLVPAYNDFVAGLSEGMIIVPVKNWDGSVVSATTSAEPALDANPSQPRLFLVETYGISSFLGDYGLGRTVRTFSLLPGEETRINVKTWRSSEVRRQSASSIVDSLSKEAVTRFTNTVQHETTDKSNRLNKSDWHVEAEVDAGWGWGSASVKGGAAGSSQSSREAFAKQVKNALQEHTGQASSARDTTISSSTEVTEKTGEETISERTIRNLNYRRVLNFVFRELNQEYITKIHLMEAKVGFANGAANSWREVPLPELRDLLEVVLKPERIDEVASTILGMAGTVMDINDMPVDSIERIDAQKDGTYKVSAARKEEQTGRFLAPPEDRSFYYRFRRGQLGQEGQDNKVDGVVLQESTITMRTESLVVEALLGQADALDAYALHSQSAEVEAKRLEASRQEVALGILNEIANPVERAAAYARMFNPPPAAVHLPPVLSTPPTPPEA